MSTEFRLKSKKELMKKTKKEIIEGLEGDAYSVNLIFKEKDEEIENLNNILQETEKELEELKKTKEQMIKIDENKNKDISIMQQALNDVEEKNRDLNVQLIDLRKALKTASQYL